MSRLVRFLAALACLLCAFAATAAARFNPSMQPSFFEEIEAAMPAAAPAPVGIVNGVVEVTWEGLAFELARVRDTQTPLVIEFVSHDAALCAQHNQLGAYECSAQKAFFDNLSRQYLGRVRFVRFDVSRHPAVLNGPDVRVLPAHVFVESYSGKTQYKATKVWGLLDEAQLQQALSEKFGVAP